MITASARVLESARAEVHYVAYCDRTEGLILVAERRRDGRLEGLAHAADLPAWKRVVIRNDVERRPFYRHRYSDPIVAKLHYRIPASGYEGVSLAVLDTTEECAPGQLYATARVAPITDRYPVDLAEAFARAPTLLESAPTETKAMTFTGVRVRRVRDLEDVFLRLDGPRKIVYATSDTPIHLWFAGGSYVGYVEDDQITWQRFEDGRGPAFAIGVEPDGGMWSPAHLIVTTADPAGAITVHRIPLSTGGC
jgi:hypothetical protein